MRISALEQLPKIGPETPVVLELSSWQLEGLGEAQLSPQYACVTNLSEDHLDRYGSMEAYADAKAQIFLHQDTDGIVVLNWKDPLVHRMSEQAMIVQGPPDNGVRLRLVENRIWFCEDTSWVDILEPDRLIFWQQDELVWYTLCDGLPLRWNSEIICTVKDVQLIGRHNLANVAAAAALAKAYGVETENIKRAIQNFTGVPDRMEQVRVVNGVRFINDTTATAPAAAIAALHSVDAPTVVIAGGADKRLSFDEFAQTLVQRAKAIVLLNGTATPKLQAALDAAGDDAAADPPIVGPFDSFAPAVEAARELAVSGDIVLLSPGCASFGMFKNEFDRGEQFREIVWALPS
jgi:UDP-N-acetylmuramoylalanine--D-glutamate ligase